jgi:outer membrane protein OmpA-like peptidoglycan-associated protein
MEENSMRVRSVVGSVIAINFLTAMAAQATVFRPLQPSVQSDGAALPIVRISTASQRLAAILADKGYTDIRFTSEVPPIYVAQACRNGNLFEITLNRMGDIRATTRFGRCAVAQAPGERPTQLPAERPVLPTLSEIQKMIAQLGYRNVTFTSTKPPHYQVEACRQDDRILLTVNRAGAIVDNARIGRCGLQAQRPDPDAAIPISELQQQIAKLGYKSIVFIDARPPTYVVQACQDERKYLIRLDRRGAITESREVGRCSRRAPGDGIFEIADRDGNDYHDERAEPVQLPAATVFEDALYGRGYLNIRVIRNGPPLTVLAACNGRREYHITLDRNARVVSREYKGECGQNLPVLGPDQVRRVLRSLGYRKITLDDSGESFLGRACYGVREFALRVSARGEVDFRKAIGWCDAMRDREVEVLAPNQVNRQETEESFEIAPSVCQQYLDWMQAEKPILYEKDSSRIDRESRPLLQLVVKNLERCRNARLRIEGHTDNSGARDYNLNLSEERAKAVYDFLVERDVPANRLQYSGYGERHPILSNDSDEDRARNRRIDLILEWDDRDHRR